MTKWTPENNYWYINVDMDETCVDNDNDYKITSVTDTYIVEQLLR